VRRDIAERGRDFNGVLEQYERFVKPAFDDYIAPTKKHANIIIPNGSDNSVAIDLIAEHIRSKINRADHTGIRHQILSSQKAIQSQMPETLLLLPNKPQVRVRAPSIQWVTQQCLMRAYPPLARSIGHAYGAALPNDAS